MITIYFKPEEDGFLNGWGSIRSNENEISLEVDKDHEVLTNPEIFKYVDGELIKDEERQQQLIDQRIREENKLSDVDMLAMAVMELTQTLLNGSD